MSADPHPPAPSAMACLSSGDVAGLRACCRRATVAVFEERDDDGNGPLHVAARDGAAPALRLLLEALSRLGEEHLVGQLGQHNGVGFAPLHLAIAGPHFESVAVLLEFGAGRATRCKGRKHDELYQILVGTLAEVGRQGSLPGAVPRILGLLRTAGARPDACLVPGFTITPLSQFLYQARSMRLGGTAAARRLLDLLLSLWPAQELPRTPEPQNRCDTLSIAVRCRGLFRPVWDYFRRIGRLRPDHIDALWGGRSLLDLALADESQGAWPVLLEYGADPVRPIPCPIRDPRWRSVTFAGQTCALAMAMWRGRDRFVERALAACPRLWTADWAALVDCCRFGRRLAWLAEVVQRRDADPSLPPPTLPSVPDAVSEVVSADGFAPITNMDLAINDLALRGQDVDIPMSSDFMRRHFALLFRSRGPDERRPSWALYNVLHQSPSVVGEEFSALLSRLTPPPPASSHALFAACLHSRALLLAAVRADLRPHLDWARPEDANTALHRMGAEIGLSDAPLLAWAVTVILLQCHPRLTAVRWAPVAPDIRARPFPLVWQTIGAVRAELAAAGRATAGEMEWELGRRGVRRRWINIVLLRGRAEKWLLSPLA